MDLEKCKKKKEKKRHRQYHLNLTLGKRIYLSICKGYIFIILGIIL